MIILVSHAKWYQRESSTMETTMVVISITIDTLASVLTIPLSPRESFAGGGGGERVARLYYAYQKI